MDKKNHQPSPLQETLSCLLGCLLSILIGVMLGIGWAS
tara:strand:- start:429 stop:542 length:114 start_codon:yes stop_codon:yes gene_type:complete